MTPASKESQLYIDDNAAMLEKHFLAAKVGVHNLDVYTTCFVYTTHEVALFSSNFGNELGRVHNNCPKTAFAIHYCWFFFVVDSPVGGLSDASSAPLFSSFSNSYK